MLPEFKYLKHIQLALLDDIMKGNVIPVIGAGFSRNAEGIPKGHTMPLWDDLGKKFAELNQRTYEGNPLESISEFVDQNQKVKLVEYLVDLLHIQTARPGQAHATLVQLPFDVFFTTNFDTLLEQACKNQGIPFYVVHDMPGLSRSIPKERRIIKLHGDLNQISSIIITKSDYDLAQKKAKESFLHIINFIITRTLLIIGYSVTDPDFIQFLRVTDKLVGQSRRPSYALMVDPPEDEQSRLKELGITCIAIPGRKEEYTSIITSTIREIVEYINAQKKKSEVPKLTTDFDTVAMDEVLLQNLRKPILCKYLFEFVKEAIATLSKALMLIREARKTQLEEYSKIYYPADLQFESQFMLHDTVEFFINGNQSIFEALPSYKSCVKIMDEDLLISQQVNKRHRIFGLSEFLSYWTYISHILKKVTFNYIVTGSLDINYFIKMYSDLEAFFTSEILNMLQVSPIYNISLIGSDSINLTDRLSIRKVTDREKLLLHKSSAVPESNLYKLAHVKYVIEYKFTIKKGFESEDYADYPSNIDSIFSSVIASLRLFQTKPVGIYSLHKIVDLDIPVFSYSVYLYALNLEIGIGEYYILEGNQISEFKQFWNRYGETLISKVLDYKRYDNDEFINIKNAMEYFLWGFSMKDGNDMFAEFMKSLTGLLSLDSDEDDPYHELIIRRASNLLESNSVKKNEIRKELELLYKAYRKITMGYHTEEINIVKIKDYAARCFIEYLDSMQKDSFSHKTLIESLNH